MTKADADKKGTEGASASNLVLQKYITQTIEYTTVKKHFLAGQTPGTDSLADVLRVVFCNYVGSEY